MFCSKCGNEVTSGNFCNKCGAPVNAEQAQQPQQQPGYQQTGYQQPYAGGAYPPAPKVKPPHYAPGSFIERLHSFGGSILFMVGIILFSAGSLFSIFATFSAASIFNLALLALPVTGFWLIFAASKMPKTPEKTMPALTLFKVSIIIDLVVRCLLALVLLIAAIALFVAAAASSGYLAGGAGALAAVGFFMLLLAGGVVVFIVLYFKAVLGLIGGIRNGITYNAFNPLPGIKIFTILTYIGVGCAVLSAIITASASGSIYGLMYQMPSEFSSVLGPVMSNIGSSGAFSALFSLITNAGIVVCLVVLTQFNNSLLPVNQNQQQTM